MQKIGLLLQTKATGLCLQESNQQARSFPAARRTPAPLCIGQIQGPHYTGEPAPLSTGRQPAPLRAEAPAISKAAGGSCPTGGAPHPPGLWRRGGGRSLHSLHGCQALHDDGTLRVGLGFLLHRVCQRMGGGRRHGGSREVNPLGTLDGRDNARLDEGQLRPLPTAQSVVSAPLA